MNNNLVTIHLKSKADPIKFINLSERTIRILKDFHFGVEAINLNANSKDEISFIIPSNEISYITVEE